MKQMEKECLLIVFKLAIQGDMEGLIHGTKLLHHTSALDLETVKLQLEAECLEHGTSQDPR